VAPFAPVSDVLISRGADVESSAVPAADVIADIAAGGSDVAGADVVANVSVPAADVVADIAAGGSDIAGADVVANAACGADTVSKYMSRSSEFSSTSLSDSSQSL
jgi:hypothetical protein